MSDLEAKITYEGIETALRLANPDTNVLPKSYEDLDDYLITAFKNLLSKIDFLEANIVKLFLFTGKIDDAIVEITNLKDCYSALERQKITREELVDLMKNKFIVPKNAKSLYIDNINENKFKIFEGENIKEALEIDFSKITGEDFIFLPNKFYEKLNKFEILEKNFLKEILQFVKKENGEGIQIEEFLNLCKTGSFFHILFSYKVIFTIVATISGLKKKWILCEMEEKTI
jgi:hypothetical protein